MPVMLSFKALDQTIRSSRIKPICSYSKYQTIGDVALTCGEISYMKQPSVSLVFTTRVFRCKVILVLVSQFFLLFSVDLKNKFQEKNAEKALEFLQHGLSPCYKYLKLFWLFYLAINSGPDFIQFVNNGFRLHHCNQLHSIFFEVCKSLEVI